MTIESLELRDADVRRFMERIEKSGSCWNWHGNKTRIGYGNFSLRGKWIAAHRFSFLVHGGTCTADAPCVLHSCNNAACVNPEHLRAGSHSENMRDLMQSGNHKAPKGDRHGTRLHPELVARGERCGAAKLNEQSVLAIRAALRKGATLKELAEVYNVSTYPIYCLRKGIAWKHIN